MPGRYLLNSWYVAAESTEVSQKPLGRTFLNTPVVLYRQADGAPVALADACPHRRSPLHLGTVIGDDIRCGYHGLTFAPSGKCIWMPGQTNIPAKARVRKFPLVEKYGWVWIWMGNADAANPSLVPDFSAFHGPEWATNYLKVEVDADAILMVDNLMDLSHVAFVHTATIGSPEDYDPELKWERANDRLKLTRAAKNLTPAPFFAELGMTGLQDQLKIIEYYPYSNVTVDVMLMEPGKNFGEGDLNWRMMTYNLLTPETETSCFFFGAMSRNFQIADAAFGEWLLKSAAPIVDEDKRIVEASQRMILHDPSARFMPIKADAGVFQARRLIDQLLDAEAKQSAVGAAPPESQPQALA
jgi:vanillate O-demethylase monooxygenase subunit